MKKADKYISLALILLLILSMSGVFIFKTLLAKPGATAVITQNGLIIHQIDLSQVSEPYELIIDNENGGSNTVYLAKDKIKFIQANCPDQLCVQTGFLKTTSDISVCLPHSLMIHIEGDLQGDMDTLAH